MGRRSSGIEYEETPLPMIDRGPTPFSYDALRTNFLTNYVFLLVQRFLFLLSDMAAVL